jgi:hypothetical protein
MLFIVAVLAGLYTYYWFKKADDFTEVFTQAIAQINEEGKGLAKGADVLRYESINVSGYPLAMKVNINKPIILLPVSAIAKGLHARGNDAQQVPASATDFSVEISYAGSIAFATNVTADRFSLLVSGDSTIKPIIGTEPHRYVINRSATPLACHLNIYNPNNMPWNVPQSFARIESFLSAFRSLDCNIAGVISQYADSADVVSSLDGFSLSAISEPLDNAMQKIAFMSEIRNAKATPAYDELANSYLQLMYDLMGTPQDQRNVSINLAQYGSQNNKIDISYEGPVDRKSFLDSDTGVNIDLKAMDSKNALYETSGKGYFVSAVHGTQRESSLVIHSNLQATEQYEQLLAKHLTRMIVALSHMPAVEIKFLQEVAKYNKPEELAAAFVPKLHAAGQVSFDADISFKSDKDKNLMQGGKIAVNTLDLTTSGYGVKLKGSGNIASGAIPAGDLVATCALCDAMISDVGNYMMNIDSLLAPGRAGQVHYVTRSLIDGTRQFLHAIDENAAANKDSKDIAVHFVSDGKGRITISGKELLEVIGLFGVDIEQALPKSEPVTAPLAPAPQSSAKIITVPVKPKPVK